MADMPALLPVYNRAPIEVSHGEGAWLWAVDGTKYLDFASGIAVNSLGHCHPHLVAELTRQASQLWHSSNMYNIPGQARLAERLVQVSCADTAFFCNSGAEAIETAIKMVRRYFDVSGQPDRYRIITMQGGFHGRTIAAISTTRKPKLCEGFEPLLEGFDPVPFNDLTAVEAAITDQTAAIMLEPVQGEGGILAATVEFLQGLRRLCDQHGLLLVADEVQCGVGRTGKFFAFEHAGIEADIIAVAKGIGGGFPLGACLARAEAARGMTAGVHGGTYGGNPLAMAVGNAVLDIILAEGFMDNVSRQGERLRESLEQAAAQHPTILKQVRGKGLMLGLQTVIDNATVVTRLREGGLLTVAAADHVIRIVPPLIITAAEIDQAAGIIHQTCQELERNA